MVIECTSKENLRCDRTDCCLLVWNGKVYLSWFKYCHMRRIMSIYKKTCHPKQLMSRGGITGRQIAGIFENLGVGIFQKSLVVLPNLVNRIITIGFKRFLIPLPQIARERMTMNIFTKVAEFVEKECKGMLTMSSNQLHTASAPLL